MPKKNSPDSVRIRNCTAEFLTFAYQTKVDPKCWTKNGVS